MKRTIFLLLTITTLHAFPQLSKRVVHNNPANYRLLTGVHAGAGQMKFTGLFGAQTLGTNLLYLHAGEIPNKAGIGQHFHHTIEEMYVILDGEEAEYTVNGHTSKIKGPAIVPCKMGDAHGILNTSGKTLRWLNFGVSTIKGHGDNFDLGDTRVGARLEPIPQFVSGQLKKDLLRPNSTVYSGNGILYRRIFNQDVFSTSWDHVDHVVIPKGSTAKRQLDGVEEVYYVMKGGGNIGLGSETAPITADDAFYGLLGDNLSITNNGNDDLEMLVIGIAPSTKKDPARLRPLAQPKAMVLQMDFEVTKENASAFEKMYTTTYVPAMTVQQGYIESKLLRTYSPDVEKTIDGEPTTYNYQILISFDTEANRRKWVASPQHMQLAWPTASGLAKSYKWRGYDVMGDDNQLLK